MVRVATREDIPKLIELGEEFALRSQPIHGFSVSRVRIIEFVNEVIEADNFVVLVLEIDGEVIGVIAGLLNRVFFSDAIALQELVWYVRGSNKGGLDMLRQFEMMGVLKGATHLVAGCKPGFVEMDFVYKRLGFKLVETQYVKNIGG